MSDLERPPPNRPLCPESIRWAAGQLGEELAALGLDYGSTGPVADLARAANKRMAEQWNRIEGETREANRRCFYFGTWEEAGHYYRSASPQHSRERAERVCPFGYKVDGKWQPANGEEQRVGVLRHKDGWTILAWWDRSVDQRGGCCGAIVFQAEVGFETMLGLLEARFSLIYDRVTPMIRWHGKTVMEAAG